MDNTMLTLRQYQQDAVDAVIEHSKHSDKPCLVVAATGSGKSLIVAALAHHFGTALCLHPSRELVAQNGTKCDALGVEHTFYCAGLGEKDFTGPVVLGTGASIRKDLEKLPHVAVLIIDEAHRAIAEMMLIREALLKRNPDMITVGLTATPYVLGRGYIYKTRPDMSAWSDVQAKNPPYGRCVFEINTKQLVDMGYLVPITVGIPADKYDDTRLEIDKGRFTAASVSRMVSKLKTTDVIIRQLKEVMQTRDTCMVFCSSIDHAHVMTYGLGKSARMITGETPTKQRDQYIDMLRRRRIRYLVNVATLTTGVDIPRVDVIAVARPSDSASLYEQIKGRGLRLSPETGKKDCLLLDYAGNIERFYPAGDIYTPQIQSCSDKPEGVLLPVKCPVCSHLNQFKALPNDEGLMISGDGYFMTLDGFRVRDEKGQEIPAHYGRRCCGVAENEKQCEHRWIGKRCYACKKENDIAARKCSCGTRLVDWNKHLQKIAARVDVVQLRRGWTGERVEHLKFEQTNAWIRADLYVKSRKAPLSVFIKSQEAYLHMRQNVPYAVAWKRASPGDKHPAVKVLWTVKDWEDNR